MRKTVNPKLVLVVVVVVVIIAAFIFVKKAYRPRRSAVMGGAGSIQDGRLVRPQRGPGAGERGGQRGR